MAKFYTQEDNVLVTGTRFNDRIESFGRNNTLVGGSGNDTLFSAYFGNLMLGGNGDDIVVGWDGNDTLIGNAGLNRMTSYAGDDVFGTRLATERGTDLCFGGIGNDIFNVSALSDGEARGGPDRDTLWLNWFTDDLVQNAVNLSGGQATTPGLQLLIGGIEEYHVFTGAGNDTVNTGRYDDVISVRRGANVVASGGGDDEVAYTTGALNRLNGGDGKDELIVNPGSDVALVFSVTGLIATDGLGSVIENFEMFRVTGTVGDDVITLGAGNDSAFGGEGGDGITGGAGRDRLYGEAGNDTVAGGDNGDMSSGGSGYDRLSGGAGHDTLWGGYGLDTLTGETGNDWLYGDTADDDLAGGAGNDRLYGGKGADLLAGGEGDDSLTGGRDNDTVTGGLGADVFILTGGDNGWDLITDFETGVDRIEIAAALLQFGPGAGSLDPALFALEVAVGTAAQFVLRTGMPDGTDWLVWDPNGADPAGGTYAILRFDAGVDLAASDILLV